MSITMTEIASLAQERRDFGIACDECDGLGFDWWQCAVDDFGWTKCAACDGEGTDIDKINRVLSFAAYKDMTHD